MKIVRKLKMSLGIIAVVTLLLAGFVVLWNLLLPYGFFTAIFLLAASVSLMFKS